MRSAGCAYNDIVDRDLDARVERTRLRPLASGRVSLRAAWAAGDRPVARRPRRAARSLPRAAQIVALASLALVAAYPFMKRITWWPQAWLGLVFSWGALVGWPAVTGDFALPPLLLWLGSVFWVSATTRSTPSRTSRTTRWSGCESSARALGDKARVGVARLLCRSRLLGWGAAIWLVRPQPLALLALLPAALHLARQVGAHRSRRRRAGARLVPLEPLRRPAAVRSASS